MFGPGISIGHCRATFSRASRASYPVGPVGPSGQSGKAQARQLYLARLKFNAKPVRLVGGDTYRQIAPARLKARLEFPVGQSGNRVQDCQTAVKHSDRSEGFPLTCYFIPVRDAAGVWTTGEFRRCLPPLQQESKKVILT